MIRIFSERHELLEALHKSVLLVNPPHNYFTEMCSGSKADSYLRLIDVVYHSTLGLRVITLSSLHR